MKVLSNNIRIENSRDQLMKRRKKDHNRKLKEKIDDRKLTCSKNVLLPFPRLMRLRKLYDIGGA